MIFYHGTTEENWKRIQEEGVLFGVREFAKSRATYLTTDIDEAKQYGEIILQVEYDPSEHSEMNNYTEGCWQCRVYEPIPIDAVKECNEKDMTQEEKLLLLQDLCARLPYGVKIRLGDYDYQVCGYNSEKEMPLKIWYYYDSNLNLKSYIDVYLTDYRPYLRPMSSMTEEEKNQWLWITNEGITEGMIDRCVDWLNKKMFDYRGLIPLGSALEAPEGMYNN